MWLGDSVIKPNQIIIIIVIIIVPTISLGSHQNIGLHTGACANVVLLTYLLINLCSFENAQACNAQILQKKTH